MVAARADLARRGRARARSRLASRRHPPARRAAGAARRCSPRGSACAASGRSRRACSARAAPRRRRGRLGRAGRPCAGVLDSTSGARFDPRQFASYVWQFYLPRLPFMTAVDRPRLRRPDGVRGDVLRRLRVARGALAAARLPPARGGLAASAWPRSSSSLIGPRPRRGRAGTSPLLLAATPLALVARAALRGVPQPADRPRRPGDRRALPVPAAAAVRRRDRGRRPRAAAPRLARRSARRVLLTRRAARAQRPRDDRGAVLCLGRSLVPARRRLRARGGAVRARSCSRDRDLVARHAVAAPGVRRDARSTSRPGQPLCI